MSPDREHRELPESADSLLRRVASNREHGATYLARSALRAVREAYDEWGDNPRLPVGPQIRRLARRLTEAQPAMGAFLRWGMELDRLGSRAPTSEALRLLKDWLQLWEYRLKNEAVQLVKTSVRHFPPRATMTTLSFSRSVLDTLLALPTSCRPMQIFVLESEPGGEGKQLFRRLRSAGLPSLLVPDPEGPRSIRESDLFLFGADAVFADGSTIHKIGTRPLARIAHALGTRTVSIAGLSKFVPRPRRPPSKLPRRFDITPGRWISEFWTDGGRVNPNAIPTDPVQFPRAIRNARPQRETPPPRFAADGSAHPTNKICRGWPIQALRTLPSSESGNST